MVYSLSISILLIIWMLFQIMAIGFYFANKNNLYINNFMLRIILGTLIYFFISFIYLLTFKWMADDSIVYLVVGFFIKDVFITMFFIGKIPSIFSFKINWHFFYIIMGAILIVIINYYGLSNINEGKPLKNNHYYYETWTQFVDSFAYATSFNRDIILDWILSFVSALFLYALISGISINISRQVTIVDFIIAFIISLILITILNCGLILAESILVWFIIAAGYYGIQIIEQSRRKYAIFYSLAFVSAWSIDNTVIIFFFVCSLITTLIYTFLKKNKVYLFWIQLMSPLVIMSTFYLYKISIWLTVITLMFSIIFYIYVLLTHDNKIFVKINELFIRTRIIVPTVILSTIVIGGVVFLCLDGFQPSSISKLGMFVHLPKFMQNYYIGEIILILIASISSIKIWQYKGNKIIKHRIFLFYAFWIVIFAFNPLFEILLIKLNIYIGFQYLRVVPVTFFIIYIFQVLKKNLWLKQLDKVKQKQYSLAMKQIMQNKKYKIKLS